MQRLLRAARHAPRPGRCADAARRAQIQARRHRPRPPGTLPYAGYGQGEVLACPLRMARSWRDRQRRRHPRRLARRRTARASRRPPCGGCVPPTPRSLRAAMREVVTRHRPRARRHRVADRGQDRHRRGQRTPHRIRGSSGSRRMAGTADRVRRDPGERRLRRPVAAPLAGDIVTAAAHWGPQVKRIVERARQFSKTVAGGIRRAVDPPLDEHATPSTSGTPSSSPSSPGAARGRGRRRLPDGHVKVKVVAADPASQRALRTVLDEVQGAVWRGCGS